MWILLIPIVSACQDIPVDGNRNASNLFDTIIQMSLGHVPVIQHKEEQFFVHKTTNGTCEVYFEHSRLGDSQDWIQNLIATSSSLSLLPDIKGATGFIKPYEQLRTNLWSNINLTCGSNYTLVRFVGYSRGGGLATLAAAEALTWERFANVELWTWGSLKILHRDSEHLFNSTQFSGHRFVYGNDPWVSTPCDPWNRFVHVGEINHCYANNTPINGPNCFTVLKNHLVHSIDHLRYPFPSNEIDAEYLTGYKEISPFSCKQGKCDTALGVWKELKRQTDTVGLVEFIFHILSGCMHDFNC